MKNKLALRAYGKINLGLDVLRKREDGYHDVRMIMQTVGIYDKLELTVTDKPGISVKTNLYYLPNNENNLVYKAAKLLLDEFQVEQGIEIDLQKFIPVSAGMAGGSSDAASVLFGVNKLYSLGLKKQQLMDRGVKIGADVPYCLMRGTALSEGIGEKLTPLPPVPQCHVVLAKPGISISTKTAYESLNANQLRPEQHPDIDGMIEHIKNQDLFGMAERMGNVLELVTAKQHPVIDEIKGVMNQYGALGAMMSGSGPTVFGLYDDEQKAMAAYKVLRYGKYKELAKQVYLTDFFHNKKVGGV